MVGVITGTLSWWLMIYLGLVVLDLLWGLVVVVDGWSVLIVEWIGMLGLVSVKSQVG